MNLLLIRRNFLSDQAIYAWLSFFLELMGGGHNSVSISLFVLSEFR